MSRDIVKEIQNVELDALKEFKKVCDQENIKFFLRGGSVMGAVKYHGFIPWDDDMDVAVPRDDYEKLIQLFSGKTLAGKYKINSYRDCEELHCYFPRMVLLEEERIRQGLPKNTNLGLHLMDIFPLDGAPDGACFRKLYFLKVYFLRLLASLGTFYEGSHVNMHNKSQQRVIDLLRFLKIHKVVKQRQVYSWLEKLYTKYDWEKQNYCGTITASLVTKEVMPKDIWGKGTLMPFHDVNVLVPEKFDAYLKRLYGENYMNEEPKAKDRKSHLGRDQV